MTFPDLAQRIRAGTLKRTDPVQLPSGLWYKVDASGTKIYAQDADFKILHRLDGPAVETEDASVKEWYVNGKCHRLDGPAIVYADGSKKWCVNGKYHRLDGPALGFANGPKYWYVNGQKFSKREFDRVFGKYKNMEDRQVVADVEGMFE